MATPIEPFLDVELTANGEPVSRRVTVRQTLADFLREELGLTSVHVGCEHGVCGACTVRVNGDIVRSCLMFAAQCEGARVETVEGLARNSVLAALQEAFHKHNALQCGFCTPAMLLSAAELVDTNPHATREEIRVHLSGNYCRCTGYQSIVDAVEEVFVSRKEVQQ
jgi:aerobic carbon-monoxide dehydrogenase small subunit